MHRLLAALVFLAPMGCAATAAEAGRTAADTTWPTPPQIADPEAEPPSVDEMLRHLESLPPRQRAVLTEAMGTLVVNCPYTRASLQLPLVMHAVISRIDTSHIDPDARDAWRELQRGLEVHVALLDTIGVDLRSPTPGDHLHGAADPGAMVDRTTLAASADPIGTTMRLIEQNNALVDALDEETKDLIRGLNDTAYARMGQTTMFHQTDRWHQALRRIAPSVTDVEAKGQVDAMLEALSAHDEHGC